MKNDGGNGRTETPAGLRMGHSSLSPLRLAILISIVACAFLLVNTPGHAKAKPVNRNFVPVSVSRFPPQRKLAASNKQLIHEGITLKALVDTFGPGWMPPFEGIGIFNWFFDDGSVLHVLAQNNGPDDVLAFDRTKESYMWWSPK